jgi:WG containing repeat
MKLPILILALIATTTAIKAQKPRIEPIKGGKTETYSFTKGGDSVRFVILKKKDTAQTLRYFRNGNISSHAWRKDSLINYDAFGRLLNKRLSYSDGDFDEKNLVIYFANGRVFIRFSFKNNVEIRQSYDDAGNLSELTQTTYSRNRAFTQKMNGKGKIFSSSRIDTLASPKNKQQYAEEPSVLQFDTLFYDNGRPFNTTLKGNEAELLNGFYFNADGSIAKTMTPDSLKLIKFKDNVDCYYGLKNRRGDTIVPPKFDRIDDYNDSIWEAYQGNSATLFKLDGTPMPVFSKNLTGISSLRAFPEKYADILKGDAFVSAELDLKNLLTRRFVFNEGDKTGVVTSEGVVERTPQYLGLFGLSIDDGKWIQFEDNVQKKPPFQVGYVDKAGKILFGNRFKTVIFADESDYFFIAEAPLTRRFFPDEDRWSKSPTSISSGIFEEKNVLFGLGKSDGTVLLPRIFNAIENFNHSPLFITRILKPKTTNKTTDKTTDTTSATSAKETEAANDNYAENYEKNEVYEGIFNAESGRWLVDSVGFQIGDRTDSGSDYFIIWDLTRKKYGVMDTSGAYLLPLDYDFIRKSKNSKVFILKKGKNYQICTINDGNVAIRPTTYDFLDMLCFDDDSEQLADAVYYFLAKQNGKWGVIDTNETRIKPFEFDYVSNHFDKVEGFMGVKNEQAAYFTLASLPNETFTYPHTNQTFRSETKLGSYSIEGGTNQRFFIDDTGHVVLPPQYKVIDGNSYNRYEVAEDEKMHKKLIFLATGKVIDVPFAYQIRNTTAESRVILVKDKQDATYGVVSTDGKVLVPCVNYGVAIGDVKTSTFFVKRDTPLIIRYTTKGIVTKSINPKQLNLEDNSWLMYNGDGKLLDAQPFRFPIAFKDGVGIGMQGENFNLYKTDGSILQPFRAAKEGKTPQRPIYTEGSPSGFKNILREPKLGFYTLFFNQGLTPKTILTRSDGQILVESGWYDGISEFYGKFALVSQGDKIGLIDSFGRELIAPQDLRTSTASFMDSLDLSNKTKRKELEKNGLSYYFSEIKLPIDINKYNESKFLHPDSLQITATQRATLWNLLLEQWTSIKTASNVDIPRVSMKETAYFFSFYSLDYDIERKMPTRIAVGDSTMSFILTKQPYNYENRPAFHNFYRQKGRWEDLKINDLLTIQGEKRSLMNDLLTKKIKQLKDAQIDCSNPAAFVATAENRWLLTQTGIDFCFESSDNSSELVIVALTWAELTPFLKFKIY